MPVHTDSTRGTSPQRSTRQPRLLQSRAPSCSVTSHDKSCEVTTQPRGCVLILEGNLMSPRRTRPRRIVIDISEDQHAWLAEQRRVDRVSSADRLRVLIELCRESEALREQVITKANEIWDAREEGTTEL